MIDHISFVRWAKHYRLRTVESDHTLEDDFTRLIAGDIATLALTPALEEDHIYCLLLVHFEILNRSFRFTLSCDFTGDITTATTRIRRTADTADFANKITHSVQQSVLTRGRFAPKPDLVLV